MNGQSLGSVEQGEVFYFMVSNRDASGNAIDAPSDWTPTYFDVLNPADGNILLEDQGFSSSTEFSSIWHGSIDTDAAGLSSGRTYCIKVKEATGEAAQFMLFSFSVSARHGAVYDRLDYLRVDIENVIFPRLERLLGLSGENCLLDNFDYDDASNITSHRIRIFRTSSDAQSATRNIADSDLPEVGEIHTYYVTQDINLPKSRRTEHRSWIDTEAADSHVTDMQDTDAVEAPGNDGWPL